MEAEQWSRQWLGRDRSGGVARCVDGAAGLYGTAPTCYLSLAARVVDFDRRQLEEELYRRRSLHRMRALRGSQFMIPVDMIDTVVSAEDRKGWYGRYVEKILDADARSRLESDVLGVMAGRALTTREIRTELGLEGDRSEAFKYLMPMLGGQRKIATATVVGGWRSNQYRYSLWDEWFPDHPPRVVDAHHARVKVAGWYLNGHGPASVADFSWWSGFNKTNSRAALEDSDAVVVDTEMGEMYDLPGRSGEHRPEGLRLLPVWDTALVTQKGRRRMVAEADQPYVYSKDGNLTSTVAWNGQVVGIWDRQGDDEHLTVKVAPLTSFGADLWQQVEEEAQHVGRALGVDSVEVIRVKAPVNLLDSSQNRFLSPLSGS